MAATNKLLIIVTNVGEYEKVGYRTGLWLGELTHFWEVGAKAGFEMDLASPSGGYVPIDPESLLLSELGHAVGLDGKVHEYYENRAFMDRLVDTMNVGDVEVERYDAIYLTGGHGVCFDFPRSHALAELVARFYESERIVAAVCHGPSGLLEAKLHDGLPIIAGKKVTGYSWVEEVAARRANAVPFSLEDELKKRGAKYSKATLPFAAHVVEDGRLITGQNPGSARAVGKAVVERLKARPVARPPIEERVGA
jgi:putative intracellular protease/amidase